jgi:hypothetical protein
MLIPSRIAIIPADILMQLADETSGCIMISVG